MDAKLILILVVVIVLVVYFTQMKEGYTIVNNSYDKQIEQVKKFILDGTISGRPSSLLLSLGVPMDYGRMYGRQQNDYWFRVWYDIINNSDKHPILYRFITRNIPQSTIIGGPWMRAWQYILLTMKIPKMYTNISSQFTSYNKLSTKEKEEYGYKMAESIDSNWSNGGSFLCWLAASHPEAKMLNYYIEKKGIGRCPPVYDSDSDSGDTPDGL